MVGTVVVQFQLPLVNVVGTVTPVGIVMLVVIGPVVGAVPTLETVTGNVLGCPAIKAGLGDPIAVVKSGTPATGAVGVNGVAALLPVAVSPGTGAVVALNIGLVPTAALVGVIGTLKLSELAAVIDTGFVQATVELVVVQLQPLLIKLAGAVTPAGNVTVVLIGPVAVPVPMLATVTGKLLGLPATKAGLG